MKRLLLAVLMLAPPTLYAQLDAIPGCYGGGCNASGGRGGQIIVIDNPGNLWDDFKAACEATGPRHIVFHVAGIISRGTPGSNGTRGQVDQLYCNPELSIWGQTAPGDGVAVYARFNLQNSGNTIVQGMKLYQHEPNAAKQNANHLYRTSSHTLKDMVWANNTIAPLGSGEILDLATHSGFNTYWESTTFQWNILGPGYQAQSTSGREGSGFLLDSQRPGGVTEGQGVGHKVTFLGNFYHHLSKRRCPLVVVQHGEKELINNVINADCKGTVACESVHSAPGSGYPRGLRLDWIGNTWALSPGDNRNGMEVASDCGPVPAENHAIHLDNNKCPARSNDGQAQDVCFKVDNTNVLTGVRVADPSWRASAGPFYDSYTEDLVSTLTGYVGASNAIAGRPDGEIEAYSEQQFSVAGGSLLYGASCTHGLPCNSRSYPLPPTLTGTALVDTDGGGLPDSYEDTQADLDKTNAADDANFHPDACKKNTTTNQDECLQHVEVWAASFMTCAPAGAHATPDCTLPTLGGATEIVAHSLAADICSAASRVDPEDSGSALRCPEENLEGDEIITNTISLAQGCTISQDWEVKQWAALESHLCNNIEIEDTFTLTLNGQLLTAQGTQVQFTGLGTCTAPAACTGPLCGCPP